MARFEWKSVALALGAAALLAAQSAFAQEPGPPPAPPDPAPPQPETAPPAPPQPASAAPAAVAPVPELQQVPTTSAGLVVIPTAATGNPAWAAGAGAEERKAPLQLTRPRPDLKPLAVFGVSAGVQAVGMGLVLMFAGADYEFSDASMEIGYGVMLGLTPIADSVLGWVLMQRSQRYDAPLFSTLIGAYLGAALSYVCVYFFQEADDPEVDGHYDDDRWFQNDGADNRKVTGAFALVIAPILLPAIGAGLGALAGRKPLEKKDAIALAPPMPVAFPSGERGGAVPGVLLSGAF